MSAPKNIILNRARIVRAYCDGAQAHLRRATDLKIRAEKLEKDCAAAQRAADQYLGANQQPYEDLQRDHTAEQIQALSGANDVLNDAKEVLASAQKILTKLRRSAGLETTKIKKHRAKGRRLLRAVKKAGEK